jgi:prophage regulatory protein
MQSPKTSYSTDKQLAKRFHVHRTAIWRWVKKNGFPAPVRLSKGCTRWRDSDVEAWEKRI